MYEYRKIICAIGQAAAISLIVIISVIALLPCAFAEPQAENSPRVHELATQLAEEWLKEQRIAQPPAAPLVQEINPSYGDYVNSVAGAFHDEIFALAAAIPDLPHAF